MHNVKRLSAAKRAEKRRENEERAKRYNALSSAVMTMRKEGQLDQAALDAAERVLHINPDHATVWNFRRTVLKHMHPDDADADGRRASCECEFKLTQEALGANPKSYPSWFHRMWVMKWGCCEWQWAVDMKLTTKMLTLDERNFHCWTYRRFVAQLAAIPPSSELQFSLGKVEHNFSNYSAWHYRSKLLPRVHRADDAAGASYEDELRKELLLLRSAFFTAPEDQSAWFYQRWLLGQLGLSAAAGGGGARAPSESLAALMRDELGVITELLELEPDCKWPLAAATFLGDRLGDESAQTEQRLGVLQRVDPMRKAYYEHQLAHRRDDAAAQP